MSPQRIYVKAKTKNRSEGCTASAARQSTIQSNVVKGWVCKGANSLKEKYRIWLTMRIETQNTTKGNTILGTIKENSSAT